MTRIPDAEKETLKQAAEAASALIVRLEEQRSQLEARLQALRAIVDNYDVAIGKRHRSSKPSSNQSQEKSKRAKKGEVVDQLEAVMADAEKALTVTELRERLKAAQNEYGRGTIYAALSRERNKKFVQNGDNRWHINPMLAPPKIS